MTLNDIRAWVRGEAEVQHSRSSGPGGQNVNKVNTRVTLRIPIEKLPASDQALAWIKARLSGRLNNDGDLLISSSETRSQLQNRRLAEMRASELIFGAMQHPKKRRKTKPSNGSVERRLNEKKHRSDIKKNRRIQL